jgi:hypothetical protein
MISVPLAGSLPMNATPASGLDRRHELARELLEHAERLVQNRARELPMSRGAVLARGAFRHSAVAPTNPRRRIAADHVPEAHRPECRQAQAGEARHEVAERVRAFVAVRARVGGASHADAVEDDEQGTHGFNQSIYTREAPAGRAVIPMGALATGGISESTCAGLRAIAKSAIPGFVSAMSAIFFSRRQLLMRFSAATASFTFAKASCQTRRLHLYFAAKPGNRPCMCSASRLFESLVTPT